MAATARPSASISESPGRQGAGSAHVLRGAGASAADAARTARPNASSVGVKRWVDYPLQRWRTPSNSADMTAGCVKALSSKQTFVILSDLKPNAVPVKSAKAVMTVGDLVAEIPDPVIALTYDGPDW